MPSGSNCYLLGLQGYYFVESELALRTRILGIQFKRVGMGGKVRELFFVHCNAFGDKICSYLLIRNPIMISQVFG